MENLLVKIRVCKDVILVYVLMTTGVCVGVTVIWRRRKTSRVMNYTFEKLVVHINMFQIAMYDPL